MILRAAGRRLLITGLLASLDFASSDTSTDNVYHHSDVDVVDDTTTAISGSSNIWDDVTFFLHRNGEPEPCGSAIPASREIQKVSLNGDGFDKYQVENFLTETLSKTLDSAACGSDNQTAPEGLLSFCDAGVDHTPILLDHESLIRLPGGTLPCRFYTREGLRITSMELLEDLARAAIVSKQTCGNDNPDEQGSCGSMDDGSKAELHLYGVPAGRVFMFAPSYVGEIFNLDHLTLIPNPDKPATMEVLSLDPRVFDIHDIFTREEADKIVDRALKETSPSHRMHRSTTGTTENSIFNKRTSENAFDTHGLTALKVKKRIFEFLGFDEYWDGHDDGLQVLRYNQTKAYTAHMDYMTDRSGKELFNYDSFGKGGNRFATVLLYMSDLPEDAGGETVFSEAYPPLLPEAERRNEKDVIKAMRASGELDATGIKSGSWEEEMVAKCQTRLSVRPFNGRAVLFYSQHPNGQSDLMSKHGGCPVLKGTKWAANLWVWNTPRADYKGAPLREDLLAKGHKPPQSNLPKKQHATWINNKNDPAFKNAELYYDEGQFWGKMGHGDPSLAANTYEGHRWNLRVNGEIVKEWVIGKEDKYVFEF